MIHFRRKLLLTLYKISDIIILLISFFIASQFSLNSQNKIIFQNLFSSCIHLINPIFFFIAIILWERIFHSFRLYHSRRLDKRIQECKDIAKATIGGTFIISFLGQLWGLKTLTIPFIIAFGSLSLTLTIYARLFIRYLLKKIRLHGRNLRNIIIIGSNARAYKFARSIEECRELGCRVVGYIDDIIFLPKEEQRVLGKLCDFPFIIKNHVIDEVVIALPIKSKYEEIQKIIEISEEQGLIIRYLFQPFDTKIAKATVGIFDEFTTLEMSSGMQENWYALAKRALDILLGSFLVLLTSPIMLLATIAIKFTSPGPVFFIQERVGYNKRLFQIYKFRTMVTGSEQLQKEFETLNEADGPVFKIKHDPRITKIGGLLRKTSIDELPQLFNVIKGDMSLVGPRPLPIRDYHGFTEDWHRRRFSIKPGITCSWQISGRNYISFEEWMKLDMKYIDNWSLIGDIKILFMTISAVVTGRGAS